MGLFYLYHSDTDLAKEAFNKAQVLDPDYALAWVGQGILAVTLGHQDEASALFEHAVGLAVPVVRTHFSPYCLANLTGVA